MLYPGLKNIGCLLWRVQAKSFKNFDVYGGVSTHPMMTKVDILIHSYPYLLKLFFNSFELGVLASVGKKRGKDVSYL